MSSSAGGSAVSMMTKFENIINAPIIERNQNIEIRLIKDYSYFELYLLRRRFSSLTLKSAKMIVKLEVYTGDDVRRLIDESDFYELFQKYYGTIPQNTVCLRITFDTQKLFNYQLGLDEIANVLRTYNDNRIYPVFSPQSLGILDIHYLTGIELAEIEGAVNKLQVEISTALEIHQFGHLPNVHEISIGYDPISALVSSEVKVSEGTFRLKFSEKIFREKGIRPTKLKKFFEMKGWKVSSGSKVSEEMILSSKAYGSMTPLAVIKSSLENPEEFNYVIKAYIQAGSGFSDLILVPGVDTSCSRTDNFRMMKKYFGIENAKAVLFREAYELHQTSQYVSPIHVSVITSFMSYTGEILPFTRSGSAKGKGPLEHALFEEQFGAITSGTIFSTAEPVSLATSTLFGRSPPVGTGFTFEFVKDKVLSEEISDLAAREGRSRKISDIDAAARDFFSLDVEEESENTSEETSLFSISVSPKRTLSEKAPPKNFNRQKSRESSEYKPIEPQTLNNFQPKFSLSTQNAQPYRASPLSRPGKLHQDMPEVANSSTQTLPPNSRRVPLRRRTTKIEIPITVKSPKLENLSSDVEDE